MKKVLLVLAVALLAAGLASAAGAKSSGDLSWMTSYNEPGQINVYASAALDPFGVDGSVAGEYIVGKFNIGEVPLEWGAEARANLAFDSFLGYANWMDWGVAPMATLHWGVDFGKPWKFDFYVGAGVGVYGTTGDYYDNGIHVGFASYNGVSWQFSDKIALLSEGGYIGYSGVWGLGAKFKL